MAGSDLGVLLGVVSLSEDQILETSSTPIGPEDVADSVECGVGLHSSGSDQRLKDQWKGPASRCGGSRK